MSPQLEDRRLAVRMVEAVQSAFEGLQNTPIIGQTVVQVGARVAWR